MSKEIIVDTNGQLGQPIKPIRHIRLLYVLTAQPTLDEMFSENKKHWEDKAFMGACKVTLLVHRYTTEMSLIHIAKEHEKTLGEGILYLGHWNDGTIDPKYQPKF